MQKILHATLAAVALASLSLPAAASTGTFLKLGAGEARYGTGEKRFDGKKHMSYDVVGGYRWQIANTFALGVETGYVDLGGSTHRVADPAAKQDTRNSRRPIPGKPQNKPKRPVPTYWEKSTLSARAFVLGVNARWQVGEQWSLTTRSGIARTHTALEVHTRRRSAAVSTSGITPYLGAGIGFAVTPNTDLSLDVSRYALAGTRGRAGGTRMHVHTIHAGVDMRF
ncbi:opacity protein-like surface antigen [Luteibacter sp. 1214]|uniref:outer membrane beta-barrel protein n=1 Tax=Luteibacter sp. 1214 TaxID=2817735 RepID=UPI00285428CD|nr:outer membrane beta-barrel protein [Luteibacter sp. 1214]MDR6643852.1 opacity protein-like surface antigen [Luteibacter sp. 1214]